VKTRGSTSHGSNARKVTRNASRLSNKPKAAAAAAVPVAGWHLFRRKTRGSASVDMQLSDSLYASADWNGLQAALRAADWKGEDYLRFALLAYSKRVSADLIGSRDFWKQALTSANRNVTRVQNLQNLAVQWNWPQEQLGRSISFSSATPRIGCCSSSC